MKKLRTLHALALLSALIISTVPIFGVKAQETLIWEADVPSHNPLNVPVPVTSPVLEAGRQYRIVAQGSFMSCDQALGIITFVADAQYYTWEFYGLVQEPSNWWLWTSHILASPSFLQIDGMDVSWGPFSNGGASWSEGHEYSIYYIGTGAPITFTIVDWIDGEYAWNFCHMHVQIYEGPLVPPEGETAYAYGGPGIATCFLSLGFHNWGWTNGPLGPGYYEFDIYAGAAKCDITKGTLVGTLTVDYDGSTATVTYTTDAGWAMDYTQLYVGSELLPRNAKGDYTTSPGQYPSIHYTVGGTTSDTHTVTGLSGDIYVVAHADVFEV